MEVALGDPIITFSYKRRRKRWYQRGKEYFLREIHEKVRGQDPEPRQSRCGDSSSSCIRGKAVVN
jgi:hypothetical protein